MDEGIKKAPESIGGKSDAVGVGVGESLRYAGAPGMILAYALIVSAEGAVFNIIIGYWTDAIPTAAAMTLFLVIVYAIHFMPSTWFAETEFITAAIKVVTITVVLIVCLALLGGAGPTGTTHHAENYLELPLFPHGFKGVCSVIPLAAWGMGGQEIMGISAGESHMPRWDMPRAFKSLLVRIVIFFMFSVILIGILVRYDDPNLLNTSNAASSPFVIAMQNAGIKVLPDILNGVILIGLLGIGSESLYISSRVLYAMSEMKMMPGIIGRVDQKGRPRWALLVTMIISAGLTYLDVSSSSGTVLWWFSSIGSTVSFMIWMSMAATNWAVHRAIKAQNDPAFDLPYAWKIPLWPLSPAYLFFATVIVFGLVIWTSSCPIGSTPSASNFFETCIGLPIGIVCYVGYKLWFRTKIVRPKEADLVTGRRLLTEENIAFLEAYYRQPTWKRILSYLSF
ncbi:hypothetical protein SCUCBS95973_009143 [Sporothrix curviconia]|uniref:Amino acid permease/ SLC12A domain-containing protein n=1 Tax=Sporothrix curviconia TaxID=1260050 RepID=A0ABP0CSF3_9PEZI